MGWVKYINDTILNRFNNTRKPFPTIPAPLLMYETRMRPGISPMAITAEVIKRLNDAGIPTERNVDGSPNMILELVNAIVISIVEEIKDNATIIVTVEPGGISTTGGGANAGGPMVVQSFNVAPFNIKGIIQ